MPSVSLLGVSKTYPGGVVGLHPTDLAVEPGGRLALLGPSGSGKSTLLRLIVGLEAVDSGQIRIDGGRVDHLPPHRRGVAFLPQRPALYPHLTLAGNLTLAGERPGPRPGKCSDPQEIAELLCLTSLLSRYPHQISGGERQRAALARMLLRGAGVWLLDEPFSALDPVFRSDFRHDLHLLLEHSAATMILVTHDPTDALALGRRVGVLGEGRLQQIGTPDQLHDHPGNRFVAYCLGRLSLIEGRAGGGEHAGQFVSTCGQVQLPLPESIRRGADPAPNLTLGIRPEDVMRVPPGDAPGPGWAGAILSGWPVVSAEPVGSGWLLTLGSGRTRVRAEWRSGSPPPVGERTSWFLPAERCLWFDGPSGRRIDV